MKPTFLSKVYQTALMCCLAVILTGCEELFSALDNPIQTTLVMTTTDVKLTVGDTYQRQATTVSPATIVYTSSDATVATVDANGVVEAIAKGEATITANVAEVDYWTAASTSYKVIVSAKIPATITTAPTATAIIAAISATDLVTAGVADGGTMMYEVTATNTKPTTTDGFSATVPTAAALAGGTYYVWYYAKGDAQHADSEIAASAVAVAVAPTLSTPLTLQVLTPGTIVVNKPQPGMQYSLNGGAKTAVPDGTAINGGDLSVGDLVSFYGDGTNITAYYDGTNYTTINGGTAEVKVYGNIMSLVDEENFATNKTLTADFTFVCLFQYYTTLKDASDLLLPAMTLTANCYNSMFNSCTSLTTAPAELPAMTMAYMCYAGMFIDCTSLTTAPKLPATTLATGCYYRMFKNCTSLTNAYVKAAYTTSSYECTDMFGGCTNAATLHTIAANKASWDGVMGLGKTWSTWTTASDWTD